MKTIRFIGKFISWLAVLISVVALGILIYEYVSSVSTPVSGFVRDFIRYTLSGAIGFLTINGNTIGDILHGFIENANISIQIFYIVIMGVLTLVLIIFAMADSKLINIIEIVLGVLVLLFISWLVAIPLLVAGIIKLITKKGI